MAHAMTDFTEVVRRWKDERGVSLRALARAAPCDPSLLSRILSGKQRPSGQMAAALDNALGAGGQITAAAAQALAKQAPRKDDEITIMLGHRAASDVRAEADSLASALTDLGAGGQQEPVTDLDVLAASVDAARMSYQGCRYEELGGDLSGLLVTLNASCAVLSGDALYRAHALSADAHHVAAGLMLKRGDPGLASLAADRSMRAALASGDPVAVAASARIVTHALMSGGHLPAAVATATSYATRLDRDLHGQTPESLSVYGALLLRGAVAAAMADDRHAAAELLAEAEEASRRLGVDGNYYWTAFGPVNTAVHRVSIAVTLGDAGTAIDAARGIDVGVIAVTERKATLLIDTARALLQRGRHEHAYRALRAAHLAAPEEVTGRAAVRLLVRDLAATAPVSVRRDASRFAASIGPVA
jgi:transcriptional regulator with XRE-family HTH domain